MALDASSTATDLNGSSLLNTSTFSTTLGGSPSSPACAKIFVRNQLLEYIDDVRSLVRNLHEVSIKGLPQLYPVAVEETLDSVVDWLQKDNSDEVGEILELDIRFAFDRLQEEMTACGVTLYLEMLTREARQTYQTALETFLQWLIATQHKTGGDQPLTEAVRLIMTDFALQEKQWVEKEENIAASRREFEEKIKMIRELRNDEYERRKQDERIVNVMELLGDGSSARRRQLFKHVSNRAAALRATPKDNLSARQRKECKKTANDVMKWIDENYIDGSYEDLSDQLQRVNETTQEVSAAADIVARRNELMALLDFIRSSITVQREVMDCLGEDRVEGLAFVVAKSEHWLEEHPNPTIQTLEKFVESLRLAAFKYGLSCPTEESPLPTPQAIVDAQTQQQNNSDAKSSDLQLMPPTEVVQKLLAVNVACVMLEELAQLRVACASSGCSSFIVRRIAPLQSELLQVVEDELALQDGAAPLLRRYKAVLLAVKDEAKGTTVPASCWSRVLQFEEAEGTD